MRPTYDWYAVDIALRHALSAVHAAQRHWPNRKRVLLLKDIAAAEQALAKVRRAVQSPADEETTP